MATCAAQRVRVLFIVNSLQFGGAEKHVVTLLNHIDIERFELTLCYLKNDTQLLPQLDQSRLQAPAFCLNVASKIDGAALRRLADFIDAQKIDVLLCTNNYPLWYGMLVRPLLRARTQPLKVVEVLHTTGLGSFKQQLQLWITRPFYWACQHLVYVCENQRRFWRKRALSRWRDQVIHNGIDVEYFSAAHFSPEQIAHQRFVYRAEPEDFVIGICAVLRPEKAHGDLLQAVAQLRARGLPVKLWIIGDGPERARLEAQIGESSLRSVVLITGFQSDVRLTIAAVDAMAIVSHAVETFSIAALEAMALGKPMVMSDIGGASEQVEPGVNGYLFPAGDIAALAAALARLMQSGQTQALGQAARVKVCQQFSLQGMVQQYENMLLDVAAPGQRSGA